MKTEAQRRLDARLREIEAEIGRRPTVSFTFDRVWEWLGALALCLMLTARYCA